MMAKKSGAKGKTAMELRCMLLETTVQRMKDASTQDRIQHFADHGSSFEAWFNWELAHAFQVKYRWPKFSAHRELPLAGGGYADIGVYQEGDYDGTQTTALLETKIVWNNSNAGKQILSAYYDRERIEKHAPGLLVVIAITSKRSLSKRKSRPPTEEAVEMGPADSLVKRIEAGVELPNHVAKTSLLVFDADPHDKRWYIAPQIRINAYEVGPRATQRNKRHSTY